MDYGRKEHKPWVLECKTNAWIVCDGKFNTQATNHLDYSHFKKMSTAVQHAAMVATMIDDAPHDSSHGGGNAAGRTSSDNAEAAAAARDFAVGQLKTWFISTETSMLPRLLYSQIIPNSTLADRREGSVDCVIDFWDITRLLDAITMIQDALKQNEKETITQWFYEFLMFISVEKPEIKARHDRHNSNHGAWYGLAS